MYCTSGIISGLHSKPWGLQDNIEFYSDSTLDFSEVILLIQTYYQKPSPENAFLIHRSLLKQKVYEKIKVQVTRCGCDMNVLVCSKSKLSHFKELIAYNTSIFSAM